MECKLGTIGDFFNSLTPRLYGGIFEPQSVQGGAENGTTVSGNGISLFNRIEGAISFQTVPWKIVSNNEKVV